MQRESRSWRAALGALAGSAVLFALSSRQFIAAPTDISAWRMTLGDVPYRDFWTMYAPGSYTVLSWLFTWCGREMLVSRLAALVVSALGVMVACVLAERIGGRRGGLLVAGLVTAAFLYSGYYRIFGSYPPALLLVLAAVWLLTPAPLGRFAGAPAAGLGRVALAGLAGGAAVWFKHDFAGYALIGMGLASLLTSGRPWSQRLLRAATLTVVSTAVVAVGAAWLMAMGAAEAAYDALVRFPLTDFPHVRPEHFPWLPRFSGRLDADLREAAHWTICQFPTLIVVVALGVLIRTPRATPLPFVWWWALCTFPFIWTAAHVQLNTHAITLVLLGGLVGVAGLDRYLEHRQAGGGIGPSRARRPLLLVTVGAIAWSGLLLVEPVYWFVQRAAGDPRDLDLPHLAGLRAPVVDRDWRRGLAAAIAAAAPPEAPLLVVGARNDVMIYAELDPYWLSPRRPASRYHELHPGITDTARGQRAMLDDVARGPRPVVVREHRFNDAALDGAKTAFAAAGVPVGATALDEWIAATYEPAGRFDRYEIMRPRVPSGTAPQ